MRNPERINPFLEILEKEWNKVPDWRFGQIVCNIQSSIGQDGYYIEDDEMIKIFKQYFNMEE